jgi:hypothetical protein
VMLFPLPQVSCLVDFNTGFIVMIRPCPSYLIKKLH